MAKRKLKKNLKTFVAFSAITALLLTNGIPISSMGTMGKNIII